MTNRAPCRVGSCSPPLGDGDLRRLVRRRELVATHPGVYVDHTGEPTWLQRAWAAVLYAWPAALAGSSALRATDGPGRHAVETADMEVLVDERRRVRPQPGLVIRRRVDLDAAVMWNLGPPRLRYEEAVIDVALSASRDMDVISTRRWVDRRRSGSGGVRCSIVRARPRPSWGACSFLTDGSARSSRADPTAHQRGDSQSPGDCESPR